MGNFSVFLVRVKTVLFPQKENFIELVRAGLISRRGRALGGGIKAGEWASDCSQFHHSPDIFKHWYASHRSRQRYHTHRK